MDNKYYVLQHYQTNVLVTYISESENHDSPTELPYAASFTKLWSLPLAMI